MSAFDIPFLKMHGLGNDFVVIDARARPVSFTARQIRHIADRKRGVGCDQLILLSPAPEPLADIFMTILNADGSEVAACGNASRCVAAVMMDEKQTDHIVIQTKAGLLDAERRSPDHVAVDMGPARLDWRDIPLSEALDTLHLPIEIGPLRDGVGVGMGNPHAVFFVADIASIPLETLGPQLEHHPLFPERANIEIAQILEDGKIRMRVWERGSGITQACDNGACATLVAAARRGLIGRQAEIILDGGSLFIEWQNDNHVMMTGPVATAFEGRLHASLLTS